MVSVDNVIYTAVTDGFTAADDDMRCEKVNQVGQGTANATEVSLDAVG